LKDESEVESCEGLDGLFRVSEEPRWVLDEDCWWAMSEKGSSELAEGEREWRVEEEARKSAMAWILSCLCADTNFNPLTHIHHDEE